jgi:hypothetical protein
MGAMSSKKFRWKNIGVGLIRFAVLYAAAERALKIKLMKLAGLDKSVYTWSGVHFGHRVKNVLLSFEGIEAGQFFGNEIYSASGGYLGELKDGRLVTHQAKRSKQWATFRPQRRKARPAQESVEAKPLYAGYEDFPHPNLFRRSEKRQASAA